MTCSPSPCPAQSPTEAAQIITKNADGSYVVEIDGLKYRALSKEQLDANDRAFTFCRSDRDLADQEIVKYKALTELLRRDVKIAEQQTEIELGIAKNEHLNFTRAMGMYETEKDLRIRSQQFIPHGQAHGFAGALLKFLDSPAGQATFKLVIPTAQAIRVFTKN